MKTTTTTWLNKRQLLTGGSGALLLLLAGGRLHAQTATSEATKYKKDEAVEIRVNDAWITGTYGQYMPAMASKPHQASYRTATSGGTVFFAPGDIRKPTGQVAWTPTAAPAMPRDAAGIAALEAAVIQEINTLRANPAAWAARLEALKVNSFGGKSYVDVPGDGSVFIGNNPAAYQADLAEAIRAMKNVPGTPAPAVPPLAPLARNDLLRKASDLLASDAGQVNGHVDSQGRDPFKRADVAGYKYRTLNECVASGMRSAFGIVLQLVVDHTVADRGHRKNLVANNVNQIGVAVKHWPVTASMPMETLRVVVICATPA